MKHCFNFFFFISICLLAPQRSSAWGMEGHRITGLIAQDYLTPKAKAAIHAILGDTSIAIASNWADFIKSDSSLLYISPWHYIDFKDTFSYAVMRDYLKKDTATNAYTKLNFLIHQLKNKKLPLDSQRFCLRLLIHIAEDLHQPMHVGREADQGGNLVKLVWFGEHTNLHSIWDDKLIAYQQLSYTEYAKVINHATRQQVSDWQHQPISRWVFDSYTIAQQLYNGITEPDQKLSYRYNFDHIATVNQQLLKGGVQLAGLLNSIFG
jgi:S1/P1 Nuclease